MQVDCHPIPIDLMHNQVKHKVNLQNKRQGYWVNALGLVLIQKMLASSQLDARGPPYSFVLAPLEFPSSAPRDPPVYVKDDHN
jgi:hypothetical protein